MPQNGPDAETPPDGAPSDADRQLPRDGEMYLDHVAHFVVAVDPAREALAAAGFAPTPPSIQVSPDPAGGPPRPTGTGNTTAMLERGYIEALFKSAADTPLGRQHDAALARYAGVHLLALSAADAAAEHARLAASGFRVSPLVQMQRPVDTADGTGTAAFTVARVEPGEMAEGRVQILTHRTEGMVWQKRFLAHPNGAARLLDLLVAVADPDEAAGRFARFTGRPAASTRFGRAVILDRGRVDLVSRDSFVELVPEVPVMDLPFMGAYAIGVRSLGRAAQVLHDGGVIGAARRGGTLTVPFPAPLGTGAWVFAEDDAALPWRRQA
jgi:hypothetical protein